VVVSDDNIVIKYAHLEDCVVCTDAQVGDGYNADNLKENTHEQCLKALVTAKGLTQMANWFSNQLKAYNTAENKHKK